MNRKFFAKRLREILLLTVLLFPVAACSQQPPQTTNVNAQKTNAVSEANHSVFRKDIPEKIVPAARYLFYLHGKIVEDKGIRPTDPKFGVYEYEEILRNFEEKGFTVISEARAKDTVPEDYAPRVVAQINRLLGANVPPQNITVLGASKGAVITMLVSTLLKNKDVNFVIMSNCNDWVLENKNINLYGNILSIYDVKDEYGQTCQKFFDKASGLNKRKEVELQIGTGHAILYKPMKEWVDLVAQWAKENK